MASKEPAPLNFVHQNAILCETIKKEQKHQKLHKDYRVNPFKKINVLASKPNSNVEDDTQEDEQFINIFKKAREVPTEKYDYPQTESQSYGWFTTPLIDSDRSDIRLHHPRTMSEVTKYMDAAWRLKEQSENMQ
ncbi:cilia- and flagella-associated protein 144-like [Bolinopsis microptera]|uniref:cilia- and flagella-associated protein 144-like n=1 Tax=Bolinopsis microptera TaxID=2820187 RepID=UPI0030794436